MVVNIALNVLIVLVDKYILEDSIDLVLYYLLYFKDIYVMIKWTYEACYEEARKYKSRKEFKTKSNSAYESARKHKWLDDYTWMPKPKDKPSGYWTYERCKEEAEKYTTLVDFSKNSIVAYSTSYIKNWLKDFTWLEKKHKTWTYEECENIAHKYITISDFKENDMAAYTFSYRRGWIKNFTWLVNRKFDLYKDKIDCVYAYEFNINDQLFVYVGRTLMTRRKKRDYEHIWKDDTVSSFAKNNNISVPEMKILETNLTLKEGAEKEGWWMEKYKADGWILLNIAKAGSIGSFGSSKYTYDVCKKLAEGCNSRSEFKNKKSEAYRVSIKNGWIDEFIPDVRVSKYTYDVCKKLSEDCNNRYEFERKYKQAYNIALKEDWLDKLYPNKNYRPSKYTYDVCKELAKPFRLKSEFSKKYYQAWLISKKNGWLDEFFPKINDKKSENI